jgi:5-methylcytosine-specific restriction endonuclease McrA
MAKYTRLCFDVFFKALPKKRISESASHQRGRDGVSTGRIQENTRKITGWRLFISVHSMRIKKRWVVSQRAWGSSRSSRYKLLTDFNRFYVIAWDDGIDVGRRFAVSFRSHWALSQKKTAWAKKKLQCLQLQNMTILWWNLGYRKLYFSEHYSCSKKKVEVSLDFTCGYFEDY